MIKKKEKKKGVKHGIYRCGSIQGIYFSDYRIRATEQIVSLPT